ncbi:MAG: NAD-binding protein [Acidimicrobiia bacterium]|nr:NAD-binding protein [Acidimicrobiia bacterium]
MRAVVVGAGATTRELIRRLGDSWDIVVIDTDPVRLEAVERVRDVVTIHGDGSSAVVLRSAGIDSAATVVAAAGSDDVNLEVVKLAADAGAEHIVALARVPERSDEYRALGVRVVVPALLAARDMEIVMEPRKLASTTFSAGKAEAIEFEITPDSPVQGKALKEIHSDLWVVAAILRDGKLVVPHGGTRLLTGDRVTIVGSAADFSLLVRTFAGGVSRFPLNFGRKVVVTLSSHADLVGPVAEAAHFVRNSNAASLVVLYRNPDLIKNAASAAELADLVALVTPDQLGVEVELRAIDGDPYLARLDIASQESVGTIVAPMPKRSFFRPYSSIPRVLNELSSGGVPVLLTRDDVHFNEIVAPVRRTISSDTAGRAAIDIARRSGGKVIGVAVANPTFMGKDDLMTKKRATAWLRREASVQDVHVERHVVRGNPVRVIKSVMAPDRLLVVSMPNGRVGRWNPGIAIWAASQGEGSVLFVPAVN